MHEILFVCIAYTELHACVYRHACLLISLSLRCRRHLNIRGKSANLPAITEKDWLDLQFGIDVGVDYYALSFVRSADVIYELKAYLAKQGKCMHVQLEPRVANVGSYCLQQHCCMSGMCKAGRLQPTHSASEHNRGSGLHTAAAAAAADCSLATSNNTGLQASIATALEVKCSSWDSTSLV